MRRSIEAQAQAIDEVMTTMSQIVMLDTALEYRSLRPYAENVSAYDDAEDRFDTLFATLQTPDIDAEQLDKIATLMVDDYGSIAAERLTQRAIAARIKQRRTNLVTQQKDAAKVLRGSRLRVTTHVSDIVRRGDYSQNFPPVRADETLLIRAGTASGVCFPNPDRWEVFDKRYRRYTGYSLGGELLDKREGRRSVHWISLVGKDGAPQVTITPVR